jgi:hypothetical protein
MGAMAALCSLTVGGCFVDEFDPNRSGVFSCAQDVDCLDGERCADSRCFDAAELPTVEFKVDPTTGEARVRSIIGGQLGIALSGSGLTVQPVGGEHVFGEGHFVITIDGVELDTVDSASLNNYALDYPVASTVPVQRLVVQLMHNDGAPYTHLGAKATALAHIDDGEPNVSILTPWPGSTVIPNADGAIDIELRIFNFDPQRIDADHDGEPDGAEGNGHVHVYNDGRLPECAIANDCSTSVDNYRPLTGDEGILPIPPGVTELTVGALLVNALHCPYVAGAELSQCEGAPAPIFDEIAVTIDRGQASP